MGRPAFKEPTDREREIVRGLAMLGMNQEGIAELMKCSVDTLVKYFPEECAMGPMEATARVAGMLMKNCEDGNVAAQIFWLKARGKWRERDPDVAPPAGDRIDDRPSDDGDLPMPMNGPKLGGLTLIGPAKTKPVNGAKLNGKTKT